MKNTEFLTFRSLKLTLISLGLLLLLFAAGLVGAKLVSRSGLLPGFEPKLAMNETGSYLAARHAHATGDMAASQEYFESALRHDATNVLLQRNAYQAALLAGTPEEMEIASKRLNTQVPAVVPTAILQALLQAQKGDYRTASQTLESYIPQGFHALFLPLLKAWMQAGVQSNATPFAVPAYAANNGEFATLMHYHAARLNEFSGHQKAADEHYDALRKQVPVLPSHVMEALLAHLIKQGKTTDAQAVLDAFSKRIPDHYLSLKRATEVAPTIDVHQGLAEVLHDISGIFAAMQAWEESMIYARLSTQLAPNFAEPRYMLAGIYERLKQPEKAIAEYALIAKTHPLFIKGRIRTAYIYHDMKRTDDALKTLQATMKEFGESFDVLMARADILRDKKEFEAAAQVYTKALAKVGPVKPYHWTIYFARGAAYERAQQWDKAEPDLLKALSLSPQQPEVLNYLGYSWLLLGKNIPQAKAMIERALQISPRDVQIIDSMGWALYQLGQFEEALGYLEQAADEMPQDATVSEHLGDVYWQLGRQHEAHFQWQRAFDAKTHEIGQKEGLARKLKEGLPAWQGGVAAQPGQALPVIP